MQFALLIYHSPEEFAMRKNDYNGPYLGAWRAYRRQERRCVLKEGKRRVQGAPMPTLAGFIILRPLRDTLRPQICYSERR